MQNRTWLFPAVLVCAVVLVYGRVVTQDFVLWDDNIHTYGNPHLNPPTWSGLVFFWQHAYEGLYVPLSYMLFGLLAQIARLPQTDPTLTDTGALLNPHVFHTAGLVLHTVNVLLVYALLRRCVRQVFPAALGALLFALHPLQVESVAWISELRGLLSASFSLGALLLYTRYAQEGEGHKQNGNRLYAGALALMLAALLSKPSAVSVPLIAFVLDRWIVGRPLRTTALPAAGLLAACLPFLVITRLSQPALPEIVTPLWDRPLIAGDALAFYLVKLILPLRLGIDYGRTPMVVLTHGWGDVTWILPVAFGVFVWFQRRCRPWLIPAVLILLASLLPVLGLVPFIYQEHSTVADRYVYLALLGPALAAAFLLKDTASKRATLIATPILFALAVTAYLQVCTWDNTVSLMHQAVTVNPTSYAAHLNLGKSLSAHRQYAEAMEQDEIAISLKPAMPDPHNNLAIDLAKSHHLPEALIEFDKTVEMKPDWVDARYNYAHALRIAGNSVKAKQQLQKCVSIDPSFVPAYMDLAISALRDGDKAEAEAELNTVIRIAPDFAPAKQILSQVQQSRKE